MTTTIATTTPSDAGHEPQDEFALLTRDFVEREFPRHKQRSQEDPHRYPREFVRKCAEIGLLGLEFPEEYGGNAVPPIQQAAVMEELARGDAGLGLDILVQNSLTAFPIAMFGTAEQKARYLPRM